MTNLAPSFHRFGERLSATGVNCRLTDALRHHIVLKAGRLLRHQPRLDRINIEVIHEPERSPRLAFTARGRIAVQGPDLLASAAAPDAYAAVNLVTDRLDRALRKRATAFHARHHPRLAAPSSLPGEPSLAP